MKEEKLASAEKEAGTSRDRDETPKAQMRQRAQIASAPKAATSAAPAGEPQATVKSEVEPKPPADPGRFAPDPTPAAAPPAAAPAPAQAAQAQMRPVEPAAKPAPRAAERAGATGASPPIAAEDRRAFGGLRESARLDSTKLAKRADQAEPPEKMLERIAALRREGRQKEADDLYAEFRKLFPEYRIPEALREQVLPR
jgi:hypothetical protein